MTYPNERIPELVQVLDDDPSCDQVVGTRINEAGRLKALRVPAKWVIRKLAERLASARIPDLNSGFRAFRRDVALPYLRLLPPGFSCVTTMTLAFLVDQHHIRYVPIDYARRSGQSKFRVLRDTYRYLLQVVSVIMYFQPVRVLMPVAVTLLGLAALSGGYGLVTAAWSAVETVIIAMTGVIVGVLALVADVVVRTRSAPGGRRRGEDPPLGAWSPPHTRRSRQLPQVSDRPTR
jgi:hypothetical protein